jgi:valacyclovir hydrolase
MAWHGPPGRQLYYGDSGSGDAVVLMPGLGGSIADLGRLRRDLADVFRLVAVDIRRRASADGLVANDP